MTIEGATPVAPVLYPRRLPWLGAAVVLEERQERGLGLDGDDAVLVEPDVLEDEAQELSLGGWVRLAGPGDREVFEHGLGLVKVGDRGGRERG